MGSLVVHIGSGLPSSIDGALDVLGSLDVQSMLPYAVFIKARRLRQERCLLLILLLFIYRAFSITFTV